MDMSKIIIAFVIIAVVGVGYWVYQSKPENTEPVEEENTVFDSRNCTYVVEGKDVTLMNGYSEEEIVPGSASKIITQYFGNEVSGDFNGDGLADTAFILTQNSGGSGTFYYVAVALGTDDGCKGTNAILLGDRIAPQTTEVRNGEIVVNYADRKIGEPMTAQPSIGISREFAIEGSKLKEVTPEAARKEQSCLVWGGSIDTSLCCLSAEDFPNTCLIGACGCSADNSHEVKVCDCGPGKCFDGKGCSALR